MQQKNLSQAQDFQEVSAALVRAVLAICETELSAPAGTQPAARHKTLAALTLAVQNNLRAFRLVTEEMK